MLSGKVPVATITKDNSKEFDNLVNILKFHQGGALETFVTYFISKNESLNKKIKEFVSLISVIFSFLSR